MLQSQSLLVHSTGRFKNSQFVGKKKLHKSQDTTHYGSSWNCIRGAIDNNGMPIRRVKKKTEQQQTIQ